MLLILAEPEGLLMIKVAMCAEDLTLAASFRKVYARPVAHVRMSKAPSARYYQRIVT